MSDTAVAANTTSQPIRSGSVWHERVFLVVALAFVLGFRLLLYIWAPDRSTDFDHLYDGAVRLLQGENPYSETKGFPYPLPAVLLVVPFTGIPLQAARPVFDVLIGWAFGFALWRHRGRYALLAVLSGAYLFAMLNGQTTPLMLAAALLPAIGFLLAVRPNTSAALWIARPSRLALLGMLAFFGLSLVVRPSWPWDWWLAVPLENTLLIPPVLRPFGFILLLAALRWRTPEGRLILAIACIPQSALPYELVSLALIPANLLQMGIYVVGSWIAVAVAADRMYLSQSMAEWTATTWPTTLGTVYLPMLYLVLRPILSLGRRQSSIAGRKPRKEAVPGKERRRPNRLADNELRVNVIQKAPGGVTVKVTHLPTKVSATESGETRERAERKAHDKLAGILAGMSREQQKHPQGPDERRS